jgi:thiol-disulfide isomerase/thioredoxin
MRKLLIIVCLLGTVSIAFGQKKKKKDQKRDVVAVAAADSIDYKEVGSPMPAVRVLTPKKNMVTTKDLASDANLFVMMFNPTCGHCQEMTMDMGKNIDLFKKTKVIMIAAPNQEPYLDFFENTTHVSKYHPTFQVGVDSSEFIIRAFRYQSLPQINVYDKDRKLIKIVNGENTIESLRDYIE